MLYNVKNFFDYFKCFILHIYLGNNIHCSRNWNGKYRPFVFNSVRFFVGFFIALIPFLFFFRKKNTIKIISKNKKKFLILSFLIGIFLFFASVFQQVALVYTDVANAAFFTIFYVPMVPIIVFFLFKKKIHWSVWPSVFCVLSEVIF